MDYREPTEIACFPLFYSHVEIYEGHLITAKKVIEAIDLYTSYT